MDDGGGHLTRTPTVGVKSLHPLVKNMLSWQSSVPMISTAPNFL